MVSFELTREANDLLKLLYAAYVCRRADGINRSEAVKFGSVEDIQAEYLDKMSQEDICDICMELRYAGCIEGDRGDDTLSEIALTNDAIIYGEQTLQRTASEILQWLSGGKGILPR